MTLDELIRQADIAMYWVKERGREISASISPR